MNIITIHQLQRHIHRHVRMLSKGRVIFICRSRSDRVPRWVMWPHKWALTFDRLPHLMGDRVDPASERHIGDR